METNISETEAPPKSKSPSILKRIINALFKDPSQPNSDEKLERLIKENNEPSTLEKSGIVPKDWLKKPL